MLSVEFIRKVDSETLGLSDETIQKIRQSFYDMGQLIFEDWLEEKTGSKHRTGSLTEVVNEHKM